MVLITAVISLRHWLLWLSSDYLFAPLWHHRSVPVCDILKIQWRHQFTCMSVPGTEVPSLCRSLDMLRPSTATSQFSLWLEPNDTWCNGVYFIYSVIGHNWASKQRTVSNVSRGDRDYLGHLRGDVCKICFLFHFSTQFYSRGGSILCTQISIR